ncbi:methyl-accepting chemotaxis protein [Clostridium cylindrosporum]|uniref:Methyl-accepting chemotaxis protein McpC n=1 Tax=Clostridium cylindrosporum DSM 605 TaxID=1121307 RepID=A0A0J8G6J6_CLOCY|nr:methyl-accepting chemotaxis protein [Clostridium cylindrosporum]KMT23231.1 methyl-accepting chemotaxis protein McpC [Clostridium cylindrosporum DSM 605]
MKFRFKIIIPMIILLVASLSLLSVYILMRTSSLFFDNLVKDANDNLTNVKHIVMNQEKAVETTTETISKNAIPLANSIARILNDNQNLRSVESLKSLASSLNVEEICIINKQGVITYANVPEYINFNFADSEQTKPFLDILSGKIDSLAQEPMPKGVDGELFQFVGVKGPDGGIVQVGFSPKAIISIKSTLNMENLLTNMKLGNDGKAFVVSSDGIILFHPDKALKGKKISEVNNGKELIKGESGSVKHDYNGKTMLYTYQKFDNNYIVIDQSLDSLNSFNNKLRGIIIAIVLLVVITSSIIVYIIITKTAIKPIDKILCGIKRLEEGDLTVEIEHNSSDELGIVSKSLNTTISKIRDLVCRIQTLSVQLVEDNREIRNHTKVITSSSDEIAGAIGEIASGSSVQANSTTDTLDLTNVLNEKINVGTVELEEVVKSTDSMNDKSQSGKDSIVLLNNKLQESTNMADTVYKNINELLNMSNSIGNIVDTIKSIADQTNLLALNAAIEAARAGEHGRGFSVVAGQVSTLAEESEKSSTKIQNIVSEIISLINLTTKSVEESRQAMDEAKNSVKDANVAFEGLNTSTLEVTNSVSVLNDNMKEISKAKDIVLSSIENIASIAHENAACAEEVSSSTEQQTTSIVKTSELIDKLNSMNEDLAKLINNFKV